MLVVGGMEEKTTDPRYGLQHRKSNYGYPNMVYAPWTHTCAQEKNHDVMTDNHIGKSHLPGTHLQQGSSGGTIPHESSSLRKADHQS